MLQTTIHQAYKITTGDTELICIKTCNICNPSEYTDNQQSLATLHALLLQLSFTGRLSCCCIELIGPRSGF